MKKFNINKRLEKDPFFSKGDLKTRNVVQTNDDTIYRFKSGRLHHDTKPAIEHPNGEMEWWYEGRECTHYKTKDNLIVVITRQKVSKKLISIKYLNANGKLHRDNRPAEIKITDTKRKRETYYKNERLYCETGPAKIRIRLKNNHTVYNENNERVHDEHFDDYYINNKMVSLSDWILFVRRSRIKNILKEQK